MLGGVKNLAWGFAMAPHRLRALVSEFLGAHQMDEEGTCHIFDALFVLLFRYLMLSRVISIGFRASGRWTRKMPVTNLMHCLYFSDI